MATSGQGVLRRLLVVFEFGVDVSKVDAGKRKLDSLFKDMQKVAAAFAGGAIAKGIGNFVKDTVDEMMQIRKGAAELRITTDEMQALRSVGRALGMDIKWLHFSMERLQVSTELAARGSARQAASMQLLGLTTKKANGEHKTAAELFLDVADGIAKLKDPSKQAIAVWDLFGRGGHRLLPMLRLGRQRIEELMDATKEYGRYEKEAIEQAAQYTITLEHLRLVWTGIKSFVMTQWLPMLEKQTNWLIRSGKWLLKMAKDSLIAKAALQVLQAAMLGLAVKMALAFPQATALLGVLVALVGALDDLEVWWEGGESLIGAILDGIFGKGASTAALEKVKDIWRDIAQFAEEAWAAAKKVLGIKDEVQPEYGPETPEAFALRNRVAKREAAKATSAKAGAVRYDAKTGLPIEAPPETHILRFLGKGLSTGLSAAVNAPGLAADTLSKLVIGDFEPRFPALQNGAAAGGGGVTVNFNGPVFHPEDEIRRIAAAAFDEASQKEKQDAAASLRREKQASGE